VVSSWVENLTGRTKIIGRRLAAEGLQEVRGVAQ